MRPYGASIWMRWPEFGLHITDTGQLKHWRGDRDEARLARHLTRVAAPGRGPRHQQQTRPSPPSSKR